MAEVCVLGNQVVNLWHTPILVNGILKCKCCGIILSGYKSNIIWQR